ncbi:hypothetical protein [Prauserella halophila]|uniref:hypothetical protein n=1 Tax=Prauserella halophila TaxID=185641 RepID=UPI0020A2DEA9|nr:hypothetical protein [Prauserella halophila]MCP2234234.1 hypothetical protein [Prauserella halophila]
MRGIERIVQVVKETAREELGTLTERDVQAHEEIARFIGHMEQLDWEATYARKGR